MLHTITSLKGQRIDTGGETHAVNEVWFDDENWRLRYLGVDVGGWFSSRTALVSASRLRHDDQGVWHLDLTKEELEGAPTSEERDGDHVFDIASLPPVLTGPFGNTVSPMLIYAGLLSGAEEASPPENPDRPLEARAASPTRSLELAGDWIGAPVFGPSGEIGPLSDMLFESAAQSIGALVVMTTDGTRAIPLGQMRRRAASGGHIVVVPDTAAARASGEIPDAPSAQWLADLRAHYAGTESPIIAC